MTRLSSRRSIDAEDRADHSTAFKPKVVAFGVTLADLLTGFDDR